MKHPKKQSAVIGLVVLILVVASVVVIYKGHSAKQFAEPDKKLSNGSIELCSDYAKLCFTRPADWTRSSILHAGLVKQNDIEINPPTGTILRFEAITRDTETVCPTNDKCDINTVNITHLENGLDVISGVFDTDSSDPSVISGHTPFVQLMSSQDVHSYGLQVGKSTVYTTFNSGISFANAPKVMMQTSPGKGLDAEKALHWLSSDEGTTSKQVLSSVRVR